MHLYAPKQMNKMNKELSVIFNLASLECDNTWSQYEF